MNVWTWAYPHAMFECLFPPSAARCVHRSSRRGKTYRANQVAAAVRHKSLSSALHELVFVAVCSRVIASFRHLSVEKPEITELAGSDILYSLFFFFFRKHFHGDESIACYQNGSNGVTL